MTQLPMKAELSLPAFLERLTRTVGIPPVEYFRAWRMSVAKGLLRRQEVGFAEVAEAVGYGSVSTLSTEFSRHMREAPARYWRAFSTA